MPAVVSEALLSMLGAHDTAMATAMATAMTIRAMGSFVM
jgi:hypothetical protein